MKCCQQEEDIKNLDFSMSMLYSIENNFYTILRCNLDEKIKFSDVVQDSFDAIRNEFRKLRDELASRPVYD